MTTTDETYYYEPASGHGLPHDPLNSIVGPRPIGWVSTLSSAGVRNLAPYSFFNLFCYRPPILGFCSTSPKDSLRNARETGEFVWNLATRDLAERMNTTSAPVAAEVDEFELAGLTPAPSRHVAAARVAESGVNFECKVTEVLNLKTLSGAPSASWVVFGEVVAVHIRRSLIKEGLFDTFGAGVILRGGGPSAYAMITPDSRFDIFRPQ
jgi:flavin reductase (DIM6/NTAB) family NADH-FMN oxidoreductase RutF